MEKETLKKLQFIGDQVKTINILVKKKMTEKSDASYECKDKKIKTLENQIADLKQEIANIKKNVL